MINVSIRILINDIKNINFVQKLKKDNDIKLSIVFWIHELIFNVKQDI